MSDGLEEALRRVPRSDTRELLRARWITRKAGRERALAALTRALKPWSGRFDLTAWDGGITSTYGGTAEQPNRCVIRENCSLPELHQWLKHNASRVRTKGDGLILTGATVGPTGGSCDEETIARTALFCDADARGDADKLVEALRAVGAAFLVSRKMKDSSFHLLMPFARPLAVVPTNDFKRLYRVKTAAVLGVLSEIGELACELVDEPPKPKFFGFDVATARRYAQAEFAYCKRSSGDPLPAFEYGEGRALHIDTLLSATGWSEEPAPPKPPRWTLTNAVNTRLREDAWYCALRDAGMILRERRGGGWFVVCPLEHEHTPGPRNTSATFISSNGALWCSRSGGHLQARTNTARAALPESVQHFFAAESKQ